MRVIRKMPKAAWRSLVEFFSKLCKDKDKVLSTANANEIVVEFQESAKVTDHLKEYLQYYICLSKPGYALLVTGQWGVGKTWQVRQCVSGNHVCYVSLHGAKTAEDVHNAVVFAFVPTVAKLNDTLNKLAGGHEAFGFVSEWGRKMLLDRMEPSTLIILDDLERSGLSTDELTGVVSEYLEQRGFRIVLIADEHKLVQKNNDFEDSKEKIVGQTIKVEPQIESVFDHFVGQLSNEKDQKFVRRHREIILSVFKDSEVFTLRILRHVVLDVARIHSCLADRHLEKTEAISKLVRMFSALDIEVRYNRLHEDDVSNRRFATRRYNMNRRNDDDAPPLFVQACSRYGSEDLESDLLSDGVLKHILFLGRYDAHEIQESLDNSSVFKKPEELPPWKVVINFDEVDDQEVEQALKKMDEQFDERLVTDSGEMLHIFSLRMMLVENGVREGNIKDIEKDCIQYIDDLLKAGKLPPRESKYGWEDDFRDAHGGYVYWKNGFENEFKNIVGHLIKAREQALRNTYPDVASNLLELAQKDGSGFYDQVGIRAGTSGGYASQPVLVGVCPKEFVEVFLKTNKKNAKMISMALHSRYDAGRLFADMKEEADWAMSVLELLEKEAEKAAGFEKLRIRRLIPRALFEFRASLTEQKM